MYSSDLHGFGISASDRELVTPDLIMRYLELHFLSFLLPGNFEMQVEHNYWRQDSAKSVTEVTARAKCSESSEYRAMRTSWAMEGISCCRS